MLIRHFEIKDIKTLQKYRYPDKSDLEILAMINEWNKEGCSGRYFEMFTIVQAGKPVGELYIHEHAKDSVSVGVHIFEPFRNKGYAKCGIQYAINRAKELKYGFVISLIEKNNIPAVNLFKKLGFIYINEFINPKGVKVLTMKKSTKI